MSLKLIPPRRDKTTSAYYVRGSYLGVAVNRSTKSTDRRTASAIKKRWEREIERGEYRDTPSQEPLKTPAQPVTTFLAATVAYLRSGGERKFLSPIVEMTGLAALRDKPIESIDQIALDTVAAALYPRATPATINRQVHTPVVAVLRHAGIERRFKRPKGWRGNKSTSWLEPAQAFALFQAADRIDTEFSLFLRTLCYTGMRLNDALSIKLRQVNVERQFIYLPRTKNNEPRAVYLPKTLVREFKKQPPRPMRGGSLTGAPRRGEVGRGRIDAGMPFLKRHPDSRLFRFHAGGHLRSLLAQAMKAASLSFPRRQGGYHLFCHTYGTWMARHGDLDTFGLTRTGRWADPRSADRYRHTEVSEESRRADWLPVEGRKRR